MNSSNLTNRKDILSKIITIDGPAGAGKSTVARKLADRLGFNYLDTGAMYRTVALLGLRRNIPWNIPDELVKEAQNSQIDYKNGRVYLNGEDVSEEIRTSEVTHLTQFASDNPDIRLIMNELQKKLTSSGNFVTEGRDQGSVVFPNAFVKFYLTASPEERARRRAWELQNRGEKVDFKTILKDINDRDFRDSHRVVAPLTKPQEAIEIVSDGQTIDEIVDFMQKEIITLS